MHRILHVLGLEITGEGHEDAPVAFPHLADLPELGHRWTPRRPPCE